MSNVTTLALCPVGLIPRHKALEEIISEIAVCHLRCEDKEVLVTIRKAIDSSPELRSKKELIETFINGMNDVDDVTEGWRDYIAEEKETQLVQIIQEEKMKEKETRQFIEDSFRNGEIKTTGTDIDRSCRPYPASAAETVPRRSRRS